MVLRNDRVGGHVVGLEGSLRGQLLPAFRAQKPLNNRRLGHLLCRVYTRDDDDDDDDDGDGDDEDVC